MGLEGTVSSLFNKVRTTLFTPKSREAMLRSISNDIGHYARSDPARRQELERTLSANLESEITRSSKYIGSWTQNAASIGGAATTLSDAYQAFGATIPLAASAYLPLHNLMVIGKTAAEIPSMYSYFKDTKDYGALLKWAAMKPVEFAIPILGSLLGMNWTKKIMRQGMMYRAKKKTLKDLGLGKADYDIGRLDSHAQGKTGYQINPGYLNPAMAHG